MPGPFDQRRYQVRMDWGIAGVERLAPADATVVVDVLRFSTAVSTRVGAGEKVLLDAAAHAASINGAAVAERAAATGTLVLLGCLRNATAVARAVAAEQVRTGARTSVNIIAAGELGDEGASRFAVEDLLGAGAVVDALTGIGIDHTSPEAAAVADSFRGLRGALRHLLTAAGSGQELLERGRREEVLAAAELDAEASVPVLRGDAFVAFG